MRLLRRVLKTQRANFARKIRGQPVLYPALGSMTLDHDDLCLAKQWLRRRDAWTDRDVVRRFESAFSQWNGSKYAFAFLGGRMALSAAIEALGLRAGDAVLVPGYTCVVVTNAFLFSGVRIVYADIETDTFGLDAADVRRKLTPDVRAILLHHLYGLVCRDYEDLLAIASERRLRIIEDCAQATGAKYKGTKVGNYGHVAFYSTEQSKIMNTVMGGLAVTNDDEIADRLRYVQSRSPYPPSDLIESLLHNVPLLFYQCKDPQRWWRRDFADHLHGRYRLDLITPAELRQTRPPHYGCRMPAPVAAIGLNQLRKVDSYNQQRRKTARRWDRWCEENGYGKPCVVDHSQPVWLRYPVLVTEEMKRDRSWARKRLGVDPGVWFKTNIHPIDKPVAGCPRADEAVKRCINFPTLL